MRLYLFPDSPMINFLVWLILGGVVGWLASIVMRTDARQGLFLNVVVGVIGAYIGGLVISPMVGSATINQSDFSLSGLLVSFLGAVILLGIVNMFRRGALR